MGNAKMVIYKITNKLSGKCYIGQTSNPIEKRFTQHSCKTSGDKKSAIKAAIVKYGKNNFYIEVLGTYDSAEDTNVAEEYFIQFHNCLAPDGYNLNSGGFSRRPSEQIRQKMLGNKNGRGNKGKPGRPAHNKGKPGLLGSKHPMYGKKHKRESIIKMYKAAVTASAKRAGKRVVFLRSKLI